MISKFHVVTIFLDHVISNASSVVLFGSHFLHLCVGIAFKSVPCTFMKKKLTIVSYVLRNFSFLQNTRLICEERINHVWVTTHCKLEVFYYIVNIEVVFAVVVFLNYVMLLKLFKALDLRTEA